MSSAKSLCSLSTKIMNAPNTSSAIATFVMRASPRVAFNQNKVNWTGERPQAPALALTTGNFAVQPGLTFVGHDHIGEGCQLGLLWTVLGAAHQSVGAIHEQGVHPVGQLSEMRHRLGEADADRRGF